MKTIKFITSILIKNKIKDNFFYTIIIFSLLYALGLLFSSILFIGEKNKLFIDFGIAAINIILLLCSIFFSSECIPEIKKSKFIYWIFSLPVKRAYFFIGAFLYLVILLGIILILYTGIYLIFYLFYEIPITFTLIFYIILTYLKFLLLASIGLLLTIRYNTFTGIISLFSVYFIGSSTYNFIQFLITKGKTDFLLIAKTFYFIFPDFKIPDLTAQVLHSRIEISTLFNTLFYYFFYIIIILIIGCVWLEKRELSQ